MSMSGWKDIEARFDRFTEAAAQAKTPAAVRAVVDTVQTKALIITPVDTGNLSNSSYARTWPDSRGWQGAVGYGAEYAKWVHEMPGKLKGQPRSDFGMTSNRSSVGPAIPMAFGGGTGQGNYWDPMGEPKFLEKAVNETISSGVINIITRYYKV